MLSKLKIFIVGAGATGSVLINALAKRREVAALTCLTHDIKLAKQTLAPNRKVKLVAGDARRTRQVAKLARGCAVVVNAASPWLNLPVLQLALAVNAHYQDLEAYLGHDNGRAHQPYRIEHLKYNKAFLASKRTALFDAGVAPGLSNLLAAEAVAALGNGVDNLIIRLVEDINSSVVVSFWSPAAAADETASRPVVFERGHYRLLPRYSDPIPYVFPKPIGRLTTYSLMNNEAFTVPRYLPVKHMEVRSAGSDVEVSRLLVSLGLLETKPVPVRGFLVSPFEFITRIIPPPPTPCELKQLIQTGKLVDAHFAVQVEAWRGTRRWRVWVPFPSQKELYQRKIYASYIGYAAGICAAAFTLEFAQLAKFGAYPPEALPEESRRRVLDNIRKLGLKLPKL
jgi:saccharopine dehydrogenase-like NADP-dependent oxidoreductase